MRYYISSLIEYKDFKALNDRLYPKPGIKPVQGDKILWKMLRDRQINIFIDTRLKDDPLILTLKNPPLKAIFIK